MALHVPCSCSMKLGAKAEVQFLVWTRLVVSR